MKYWPLAVSLILTLGCSGRCENSEPPTPAVDYTNSPRSHAPPVVVTRATSFAYPLKISANGRYLVDQNNKPFRVQGDSAQSLIANLTHAGADVYLSDRQARGFNTVNVNLIEHKFAVNAPANRNGDAPFTTPGDFSTPNEAYFSFADSIVDLAASKGMLVSLAPMYLGFKGGDEGWWTTLVGPANSQAVCYNLGLYIGNRYKSRKNILWVIGGDYFPPRGSEGEARLHKIMEGIKAAGGSSQLWAGDWDSPCLSTDERAFAPAMNVNAVYTYGDERRSGATYVLAQRAYDYSPPHPAFLKETGYEDENWVPGDPASVRRYEYWAILGGSTAGGFFGNRDIWEFATDHWWSGFAFGHGPWQKALDSPGTRDMMRLGQLLDSVPWYALIPSQSDGTRKLVTECEGTFAQLDYVTAAATADRKVILAYVPPMAKASRTIGIDMAALSGPARARWFDPTAGIFIEVPMSPFPNQGTRRFSTPGRNSGGATDWILVLQVIENQAN